jgi:predicted ATPase
MKIKSFKIKNFKSIVDISIDDPRNFSVFVGPNASGKSNILEAFELMVRAENDNFKKEIFNVFGDFYDLLNKNHIKDFISFHVVTDVVTDKDVTTWGYEIDLTPDGPVNGRISISDPKESLLAIGDKLTGEKQSTYFQNLFSHYQRIFIGKDSKSHVSYKGSQVLDYSASNLSAVLGRLLETEKREEIIDWLSLLIPGFSDVKVSRDELSGQESLLVYDENYAKPFPSRLISDGTYSILALITVVLQQDEPQFLLIEEPENGLNPKVIKELVGFFREQCEEKKHCIWLASHSQSLVSELKPEELILVDKIDGETKIKQFRNLDLHGMKLDEAWMANVLGGGLPW